MMIINDFVVLDSPHRRHGRPFVGSDLGAPDALK
jgi:hypothetical protein